MYYGLEVLDTTSLKTSRSTIKDMMYKISGVIVTDIILDDKEINYTEKSLVGGVTLNRFGKVKI